MRRITQKPWFGPKLLGWGWRPITLEGWIVTAIFIAAIVWIIKKYPDDPHSIYYVLGLVGVLTTICYLTSGLPGSKSVDTPDQ